MVEPGGTGQKRAEVAPEADPRVYFAAERTFLAWIRTGLGLMGVGFAVSRFGLFLRELQPRQQLSTHTTGLSVWSGIAIVLLGVVVNITALVRHLQVVRELSSGSWVPGRVSLDAAILAIFLAVVGLGMVVYLILVH